MSRKNRNYGIFVVIIGFIFIIYKYCLYVPIKFLIKKAMNKFNNKDIEKYANKSLSSNMNYDFSSKHPIKSVYFKVAGISFEDRQTLIKKMLKKAFKLGYYERYNGMTKNEIKESSDIVYEADCIYFNRLDLIITKYNDKDAIEVHVNDLVDEDKLIMIGYVPKEKIKEVLDFLKYQEEHHEYKYKKIVNLTGGKGKRTNFDDELETVELNYGIDITLELYEQ